MKAFFHVVLRVVGMITALLFCSVWLLGSVLIAAYQCDDNCAAFPHDAPWYQKTGSWQWSVQLVPSLLGSGAAALAFYFLSRRRYSTGTASLFAMAAAFVAWFVLMRRYLYA